MAEFCLKHFNELFNKNFTEKEVKLCDDFCEECGEWTKCVAYIKKENTLGKRIRWRLYTFLMHFDKD